MHKLEELATELPQRAKAHNKWDRRQTNESVRPGKSLRHVGCYSAKGGWGSRKAHAVAALDPPLWTIDPNKARSLSLSLSLSLWATGWAGGEVGKRVVMRSPCAGAALDPRYGP